MAFARSSSLSGFLSLIFVLLLNVQGLLGCCFAPGDSQRPAAEHAHANARHKRKKISPSYPNTLPVPAVPPSDDHGCRCHGRSAFLSLTSIRSWFASVFSSGNHITVSINREQAAVAALCAPSPLPMTTQSLSHSHLATNSNILLGGGAAADIRKHSLISLEERTDIFPCTSCGEVFSKAHLLDLHQAMKHSLSELSVSEADSGLNIVRIIFLSCWKGSCAPTVCRVFKIHHSQRALARFEEYRDVIRSRASRHCGAVATASTMDERCIADGNERLRFYCSTMLCSLSAGGVCGSPYCCTCEILWHGFSGKQADLAGITTYSSGWGAHSSLPEEVEREFAFLQVRRAMLVCRVVAGRVAHGGGGGSMFESVALPTNSSGDEELIVFNAKAVLPCFVILYASSLFG